MKRDVLKNRFPSQRIFGLRKLVVFLILFLGAHSVYCLAQESALNASEGRISDLIQLLGHNDFAARQRASTDLLELGEPARPELEKAVKESKDIEVRTRAGALLKQLDQIQLAASEMHVVGIHQAKFNFQLIGTWGEDVDWRRFCAQLVRQGEIETPSPAKRIWKLLDRPAQAIARNTEQVELLCAWVEASHRLGDKPYTARHRLGYIHFHQLSRSVERALLRPDFYQEKYFRDIELDKEGQELLVRYDRLAALELWVLHRRLLEASFPELIEKTKFNLENATVSVHVRATPQPINLVLCSYHSIRWVVKPEKGATIKNVIVGGYYPQLVVGTSARQHAYVRQGMGTEPNERSFYAYKKDDDAYRRMAELLREITGSEITTFQGNASKDKNCFTVPAD
jgi:hypothetical protein